jgi:hypothetical protein
MALLRDIWAFASDDWRNWLCTGRNDVEVAHITIAPMTPPPRLVRVVSTVSMLYPEDANCDFTLDAPDAWPVAVSVRKPDSHRRHREDDDFKGLQRASQNLAACLSKSHQHLENGQIVGALHVLDGLGAHPSQSVQHAEEECSKGGFEQKMQAIRRMPRTQATLESYQQAIQAKLGKLDELDEEATQGFRRRVPAAVLAGPLVCKELSRYYSEMDGLEMAGLNLTAKEVAAVLVH